MKSILSIAGRIAPVLLPLILGGCAADLEGPTPDPGRANFARVATFGGTSMSGMQDGALYAEGQQQSIPALISQKLVAAGGHVLSQALVPDGLSLGLNPYPWDSPYQSKSHLGDRTDCNGVVSLGPVKDTLSEADFAGTTMWDRITGTVNDFSVPGSNLWDLDRRDIGDDHLNGGVSVFASRLPFAGTNKSILEAMVEQDATFIIAWPGMDEVWNWAGKGGTTYLPDAATFRARLDSVLGALTVNGAKGVIATVPDVDNIPFFTTIPPRALTLSQGAADSLNDLYAFGNINLNFQAGENGFVVEDSAAQGGIRQMTNDDDILLTVPLDSMKCFKMGILFKMIPDRCSLMASELAFLRATVAGYNAAIRDLATKYDFAVADMEGFYASVAAGIRYEAVDFDAEFAAGGFFSLDGFGPNPKGAGLIANEFIKAINAQYGAVIPFVQIDDLNGVLFP
ncbi:MAG: hypothetical protein U0176_24570 [Bacteroidia bacterium]